MFNLPWRIHWLNPLVLTAVFVLCVAAAKGVQPLFYWPVEGVKVIGAMERLEQKKLQYALADSLAEGFLASDLDNVKDSVESLPWVGSAKVRRLWPEQIEVVLSEKKPVANWLQNGFLDSNLVAFFPADYSGFESLPKLAGPVGSERKVWEFYQAVSQQMDVLEVQVDVVSMAKHGAWSLHLKNGPWILLGKDQTRERLKRLNSVYTSLNNRWEEVRLIDMRYPNGFSVEWTQ
ncbi:cell division protein FtsQ/DivIB [Oceanospirillum maris]|uniref:cell division protein FtsQ/DivIB n=1 Tax=Oceanospirillum maris TaxID=64977 RepID=UPI00041C5C50|nr:cell division protein FtsQ/DivIB [Oceanospirillum maris]